MADDPYYYDQTSDWPPPLKAQFFGVANMMNGEFQGKYVQFNVVLIIGKTDQQIAGETLVHEIAPNYVMTTP